MKLNKKYRHFRKWFRSSEIHFHQSQSSDMDVAESAFDEGVKYANFLNGEKNAPTKEGETNHNGLGMCSGELIDKI